MDRRTLLIQLVRRTIKYWIVSLSFTLLLMRAAMPDSGSPDQSFHSSTTVPAARSIVYIDVGGPNCFGIVISHAQILVPLSACDAYPSFSSLKDFTISIPYRRLTNIKATLSHISQKFSYAIVRLKHGLDSDDFAPLSLFDDDAFDDLTTLTSIRRYAQDKDPLGSPCAVRHDKDDVLFDCDDKDPPIIVNDDSIVAIRSVNSAKYISIQAVLSDASLAPQVDLTSRIVATKAPEITVPELPNAADPAKSASYDELSKIYAGSRALIIAASDYPSPWPPLKGIHDDAVALSSALTEQGFNTEIYSNPLNGKLYDKIRAFLLEDNSENSRLIVYFMGHGWSDSNHHGYLVPIDAPDPNSDWNAFKDGALSMIDVESLAKQAEVLHVLFVFDSCFSGTIFQTRSLPSKYNLILADAIRPVRQFLTAGNEDQTVPSESVFTPAFIRGIKGDADKGSPFVGTRKLGLWLKDQISPGGIQTPEEGTIQDPRLNAGDFLFFPKNK